MKVTVNGKFSQDHFDRAFETAALIKKLVEKAGLETVETDLSFFVFSPVIISDEFVWRRNHIVPIPAASGLSLLM